MLNSTPFKWTITLVAAMKVASLMMDLKPHHKIVLSHPMDRLYRFSQRSYQKLWWVAKVVGLVLENCSCSKMKSRIRGIKVYTLKFPYCFGIHLAHLVLSHTNNLSPDDSSRCPGCFPCLCYYSRINSLWKWIQFTLEQSKTTCLKTQNWWATFAA